MTETPPEENNTTEKDAAATARQVELASTELGYSDHRLYSMPLYEQPSWVIDAVFQSGALDPNGKYTQATVDAAIQTMMAVSDSQFPTDTPEAQ